ncbi:MAG: autotransporter outer membrane beta-barrel domain-containing protein, partial [Acetobacteraceae bacterium]
PSSPCRSGRRPPGALPAVYSRLSPTVYGDALVAGVERSRLFGGAVAEQAAARRGNAAQPGMSMVTNERGVTAWATGIGQNARFGASGNTGFSASSGGAAVGTDVRLGANYLAGVAAGYTGGRVNSRGTGANADLDMFHLTAYGSWTSGRVFVDGQLGLTHAEVTARRDLGVFQTQAHGKAGGWGGNADLQVGVQYALAGWSVQPSVGLRYDGLGRDQLTETGAGALALSVRSDDIASFRSMAGARAERRFDLGGGYHLTPAARLFWTHELADVTTATSAGFASAPGAQMRSVSAKGGRDGAIAGLGASLQVPGNIVVYANYNAHIRDNTTAQAITGGLRFAW